MESQIGAFFCAQSELRNARSVFYSSSSSSIAVEMKLPEDATTVSHVHVPLAAATSSSRCRFLSACLRSIDRSTPLDRCRRRRAGGGQNLAARVHNLGADPQAGGDPVAVRAQAGPAEGPREVRTARCIDALQGGEGGGVLAANA